MNISEDYLREKEPDKREKGYAWHTAIGLQAVDGLNVSEYLVRTAKKSIDGDITFEEADRLIHSYYKENNKHSDRTEEADKVSVRIAQLLSEKSFTFSPAQYISIHKRLFEGIYKHAGKIRDYNISKPEWVLDGDTVMYGGALELRATLDYDLSTEKAFSYKDLFIDGIIKHLAVFVSRLWQIHVFGEGNTRATAVFFIKYLRTLGFDVTNDIFAENARYFRNALVRANYTNIKKDVHETTEFLELFLKNLILGEKNELKNRNLHINGTLIIPKGNADGENCTLDCTLDELSVLNLLKCNNKITQKQIAETINKSERTVKTIIASLRKKELISRINGKRFGYWEIHEKNK